MIPITQNIPITPISQVTSIKKCRRIPDAAAIIFDFQSSIFNLQFSIFNFQSSIFNLQFSIFNLQSSI